VPPLRWAERAIAPIDGLSFNLSDRSLDAIRESAEHDPVLSKLH
jgi:hypothetical protein